MDLQTALLAVDEMMYQIVDTDVDVLREASRHILMAGGKRVRPRLAFLSFQAVGGADLARMVPVAASLELIHTATLVHDDINDHGTMRRNRPTVNAIWGRTFALLTGDFLFTKVYQLMAPLSELNTILAQATTRLVEGEALQTQAAKQGVLNHALYFDIIARKTASLFEAAARLGATAGGGTHEQVNTLAAYAFNVGLAFQIVDDVLDLIADSQRLGKTAGQDVAQGKGFAVALGGGNGGAAVATVDIDAQDPMDVLKYQMLAGDYITRGQRKARELVSEAIDHLSLLPSSPAVDALESLAWQMVERDR